LSWWENPIIGANTDWTEHTIITDGSLAANCSISSADLNGDGHYDIITTTGNTIHWWENDGSPADNIGGDGNSWTKHVIYAFGTGAGVRDIQAADLDGDGDNDIVVAAQAINQVIIFENNLKVYDQ
jgi:hypothetical protein